MGNPMQKKWKIKWLLLFRVLGLGLQSMFLIQVMDVGSLSGNRSRTIRNYKEDPYVHCYRSLHKADTDSSSYDPYKPPQTLNPKSQTLNLEGSLNKPI